MADVVFGHDRQDGIDIIFGQTVNHVAGHQVLYQGFRATGADLGHATENITLLTDACWSELSLNDIIFFVSKTGQTQEATI